MLLPRTPSVVVSWSIAILSLIGYASALQQDLAIDVSLSDEAPTLSQYTMYASIALFGEFPAMTAAANTPGTIVLPPDKNALLCNNITKAEESSLPADSIVLVPRGICTFQRKVYNAQKLGAKATLVYGYLASRYMVNETDANKDGYTYDDIIFPLNYHDYDCSKGEAYIPKSSLSFDPLPYNAPQNDPLLSGDSTANICRERSADHLATCPSQACLLTGEKNEAGDSMKACCAWDLYILMYGDTAGEEVHIPSAYITMQQGNKLLKELKTNSKVSATLYARWRPQYNISSTLIWAMGVAACALAAYLSAHDYHKHTAKLIRRQKQAADNANSNGSSSRQRERSEPPAMAPVQEELTIWHALAFVIMASTSLLVLFYFKIYAVVKLMYAMGCSKAAASILLDPLLRVVMKKMSWKNKLIWRTDTEDFGDITTRDIISHVLGYSIGLAWLIVAFTVRHPDRITFFWVTQDVFGICMCVLFLQVIKLNSLKVASALLIVAFFYDIFFVFLSPLIFSKSVMIDVATSGGPPTADPLWCEKYPNDSGCQGGDPLPMLLTMPRLFDYEGGSNLLGLGDIVLPGLLVSYAARFDAAKSLLGVMRGGNGNMSNNCPERKYCGNCSLCSGGYFGPLVVAYGIGLCMANVAVYLMRMGQPALLYLVPCCLGTFCFLAYRRGELADLWDSPKAIRAADTVLYGEDGTPSPSQHAPVFAEEGLNSSMVPSAVDDDDFVDEVENDA
uniref:PA domain-containing protein n=1 Tax=Amphora coffeiformis TaxID=265554 RepID=A0A7S3KYI1_9STRA